MSGECMKDELNFFGNPVSQSEVENSKLVEFLPIQAIDPENSIRFRIVGNEREYIDLRSSYVVMNVKLVKEDKTAFAATEVFYPINNFFHSIFNKVNISFNNILVATDHTNYATRAYLQTLLNFDRNTQDMTEDNLHRKATFDRRRPLTEDNI